jgi:hypothetical protein
MVVASPLIQDIFKIYGGAYLEKYGKDMPSMHKKTLRAMMQCRTKSLGGETYYCNKCQKFHYSYHSCGNRHCMLCGNDDAGQWIEKQHKNLLPFSYFLATFTMPEELRMLCRSNQKLFYSILFKASADALKLLAKDKKYLGAQIGMVGILHTWTRALIYHPHLHYLVPGGGITTDGQSVRFSDDSFLLHIKPLSKIFKAKFSDALKKQAPDLFIKIKSNTWKRDWVVHIKPVGNGEEALKYMGRYLFRIAISKNRILKLETCPETGRKNAMVTFRYTDYKTGKNKILTLEVLEFIRRFFQHVLPHNFMKVRYYGFLAAASGKLIKLRKLLYLDAKAKVECTEIPLSEKVLLCPICGSPLQWIEKIPRGMAGHEP